MNDILNPHACEKSSRHPEQGLRTISDLFVGQDKISLDLLQKIAWCTPCLAVLWTAEAVVHSVQMMRVDLPVCVGGPGSEDGARECCRCSLRFATYISPPVSFKNSALAARLSPRPPQPEDMSREVTAFSPMINQRKIISKIGAGHRTPLLPLH